MHSILRLVATNALLVLVATTAFGAPSLKPRLSTFWDDWVADVGLLMSAEEHAFFDSLEDEAAREAFARRFWESRGDSALERWAANHRVVDQLRPRSAWAKRSILLFGKPASIEHVESCGGLRPLQIWRWDTWHVERQGGSARSGPILVFVQESRLLPDSFRPWDPTDYADLGYTGSGSGDISEYLDRVRPESCVDSRLRYALTNASSFERLGRLMPWPSPDATWLTDIERDRSRPSERDASLSIAFTGAHGRHTILHGVLRVKRDRLNELVPGQLFDRVAFVGDVYKREYLVDSFEVVHHIAGSPQSETVELDVFRGLRPGRYRFEMRVFDRNGQTLLHTDRDLEVPRLTEAAPPLPGRRQGYGRLTGDDVVLLDTFPSIEVLPISSRATERTELVAITTGGPIGRVAFYVDGELIGEDDDSPFLATTELSEARHEVEAVALDPEGRELTRHSREVEVEVRAFEVRLRRANETGRVPVLVSIPDGSELAAIECFDGRSLVATLEAPPFECPQPKLHHGGLRYVRAMATLDSGATAEHILFYGPRTPENIDVQLVQLYLSVFDGNGRPVAGLTRDDFRVWEEGRQLELDRLESLSDLPISVSVLMDLSSSMGRLAKLAAESAQGFFENVMVDDDLASLLAFNDGFYRLVPFTSDIDELRLGAEGVRALGSTRLNDGVVWALSQYAGQENRRALVILSDGADVNSDYPLDQVVEAAIDAGVVVYPISLVRRGERPDNRLELLAERTGGTQFIVGSISELDEAFRRIAHELRSQYLLVYRQPDDATSIGVGAVDVEVMRSGHTTRNIRGYYQ